MARTPIVEVKLKTASRFVTSMRHILRIFNSVVSSLENKNLLEEELIEFESTIGYVGSW